MADPKGTTPPSVLPSTRVFLYARLRGKQRDWRELRAHLDARSLPALAPSDVHLWGAWFGLFGLRSNELLVITSWPDDVKDAGGQFTAALPIDTEVIEMLEFVATVRPLDDEERTRDGLYVFRFFDVMHRDVEEIAALSNEAWTYFESTDAYAATPQALFCQRDRALPEGRMLLLTWYDGLQSWQLSRTPAPEATANFRRRHELTLGQVPYATRLAK